MYSVHSVLSIKVTICCGEDGKELDKMILNFTLKNKHGRTDEIILKKKNIKKEHCLTRC